MHKTDYLSLSRSAPDATQLPSSEKRWRLPRARRQGPGSILDRWCDLVLPQSCSSEVAPPPQIPPRDIQSYHRDHSGWIVIRKHFLDLFPEPGAVRQAGRQTGRVGWSWGRGATSWLISRTSKFNDAPATSARPLPIPAEISATGPGTLFASTTKPGTSS